MANFLRLFLPGLLLMVICRVDAQTAEEKSVRETVDWLFAAMQRGDTAQARLAFHPEARLQTALENPVNKKGVLQTEPLDSFLVQVSRIKEKGYLVQEKITSFDVHVDAPLASVWATYELYVDGKLSHTGVDAFQLIRSDLGWKIIQLCDTRKR